jgi:alpha-1,2-mannosyltransferase
MPVRPRFLLQALLAFQLAAFALLAAGTHGWIVPLHAPVSTDYVSFHAAGTLARAGTPALAYDRAAHEAVEARLAGPGAGYQFFFYPPTFLLLCAALAALPYAAAFLGFQAASLAAFLATARAILPPIPGRLAGLLAIPSGFWTVSLGQNAFLTASLMAAGTAWIDTRPLLAGAALGGLVIKPHMLALVPVALLAGRRWRALAAFTLAAGTLAALALLLFGPATWQAWLAALRDTPGIFAGGRIRIEAQASLAGAALMLGAPARAALALQAAAILAAAAAAAWIWRRGSIEARGAILAAGTILAMPVVLFYDLMLAAVAAIWLLRAGLLRGALPGERALLAALLLADLLAWPAAMAWHLPLGPAIAPALALAACRRHRAESRAARPQKIVAC